MVVAVPCAACGDEGDTDTADPGVCAAADDDDDDDDSNMNSSMARVSGDVMETPDEMPAVGNGRVMCGCSTMTVWLCVCVCVCVRSCVSV